MGTRNWRQPSQWHSSSIMPIRLNILITALARSKTAWTDYIDYFVFIRRTDEALIGGLAVGPLAVALAGDRAGLVSTTMSAKVELNGGNQTTLGASFGKTSGPRGSPVGHVGMERRSAGRSPSAFSRLRMSLDSRSSRSRLRILVKRTMRSARAVLYISESSPRSTMRKM
ncbi:hypothetical protein EYF80_040304 [Liparis tanakae]|uniref:Uncharacterized protein n=1 Tax=Liparis tanakae TaxID=230148 RepID=A0A4Z2G8Q6_9TELE|nr:hypothetical protein EYF80_040304 [Liparis tanakae]